MRAAVVWAIVGIGLALIAVVMALAGPPHGRTHRLLRVVLGKEEEIMATLQEVVDAVAQGDAAVEAAAARVIEDLDALKAQVQALQDQIASGAGVTAADLDAVKASIDEVTGEAAAIDPDEAPPAPPV